MPSVTPILIHFAERRNDAVDAPPEVIRVGVAGHEEPAGQDLDDLDDLDEIVAG